MVNCSSMFRILVAVGLLNLETIPGEVHYDENFSLVIPPELLSFSRNGHSGVQADAIWGDNFNGTIDDNENEFLVYYGKFKVSVDIWCCI